MHPVVRSDFLNGLLFLDRLQRDSCFHLRAEAPPLPRFHFCSLSEAAILYLIDWSEFWGAPHTPDAQTQTLFRKYSRVPQSWDFSQTTSSACLLSKLQRIQDHPLPQVLQNSQVCPLNLD